MPLKITFEANEINDYLRVDRAIDEPQIERFKNAAMVEAETFLNTDFSTLIINDDGTTTLIQNEAPATVKDWVLDRIADKYESRGQGKAPDFTAIQLHRVYPFRG